MIVAVVNHKGGVGKTTTAVTLADLLRRAGRPVGVLDLDAPAGRKAIGAAQALRRAREAGIPAATVDDVTEGPAGAWVLVDTAPDLGDDGTGAALATCDVAVVPSGITPEEVAVTAAVLPEVEAMLKGRDAWGLVVLTRVPAYAGRAERAARAALAEAAEGTRLRVAETAIPQRAAVSQAAALGTTVAEGRYTAWRDVARAYEALLAEIEKGA